MPAPQTPAHLGGAIAEGDANTWMPDVWGYVVVKYSVRLVLDIGCGYGYALRWFARLGLNVVGIDGDPEAIAKNVCQGPFPACCRLVRHDFARGPYVHGTPFDLALSSEFLEHLDEKYLVHVAPCFQAARYALITHGEPHQDGQHHVNCRPSSYWVNVFRSWGFQHREDETALLRRTDRFGSVWGRRSLMFFERL